jgi:cytosine deaminase
MNKPLLINNAKLRDGNIVDILIEDGKFSRIAKNINVKGIENIDAENNLVSPPLCEAHVHLDAALSVGKPRYNMSGTLIEGINIWGELKQNLDKDTIIKNALEVIKWEVANGCTFIRTHADATDVTGNAVDALLEVKEMVKDTVDLQVVAFPQDCIFSHESGEDLLEESIRKGCDAIGGLPYMELSPEDGLRSIKFVFDLAEKYDCLIDIHCDENTDDQSRYIEAMARETIVRGMQGRVAASHTTAMHNYNNDFAVKLIANIKRSEMSIITNPYANSCLQNRTDGYPRHRGHTRVDELMDAGVNIAAGSDDIMDPWYPMGKGAPLSVINLLMNYAQLSGYSQLEGLFDMVSDNAAKVMCLDDYGIKEGNSANLIILDADTVYDTVRLGPEALYVIRRGNIISKTVPAERTVSLLGNDEKVDYKVNNGRH